jgi:AcrR family transcriptional regulator
MSKNSEPFSPDTDPDRRSQRTEQALFEALVQLLGEKHYDAISIKEIVERANVGRSTFYAHYPTKDDLLIGSLGRMMDALLAQIVIDETGQSLIIDIGPLFQHAQGHFELYKTLVWGSGFELLIKDGHAALAARLEARLNQLGAGKVAQSVPLPVLSYTIAGTVLLLLKWWLDQKMPHSPEQMNAIFQTLIMPGLRAGLDL